MSENTYSTGGNQRDTISHLDTGELWCLLPDGRVELWWTAGLDSKGKQLWELKRATCWAPTSGMLRRRVQS